MFIIQHRRRREKKTDYKKRVALVKSGNVRVVIRKSLDNMSVQFIQYNPKGDITLASAFSRELRKLGWNLPTGNIPSAYLTGLLAGKKVKGRVNEAILDIGLQISTKGSRIYAALKGVLDSGIIVPHSKEILPEENRIKGMHTRKEEVHKSFESVKNRIMGS